MSDLCKGKTRDSSIVDTMARGHLKVNAKFKAIECVPQGSNTKHYCCELSMARRPQTQ
ncbi:hypothetical protein BU24DRAFT_419355 [Aaosphaeria arxii CBS 175.79]|uniref:Uncharacterized protein n=1 Tax=Aaosphaeria arxii CBS 175.79 TaxID=1450172 RepID=A0A6A5Y2P3_9PLEO|nr:uncharacterized protein BU24DRAFT_419355 [Aaosphaeria arxii CBS 175.79]KAF2019728.1 hypothetical protein BU24DRAFT_419355 [Aaosphaeria arxii CBS 175.79]